MNLTLEQNTDIKKTKKMRWLVGIILLALLAWVGWHKIEKEAFFVSAGQSNLPVEFKVLKGEGSTEVGENLQRANLIKHRYYFYYYVWKTKTDSRLQAGVYELAPNMTIPELVEKMIGGKIKTEKRRLTVPEGFSNKKIIQLLTKHYPKIAPDFKRVVNCRCLNQANCACDVFKGKYDFLTALPEGMDMEGYLFPDTYFLNKKETGVTLAGKFLDNFQKKIAEFQGDISQDKLNLHQLITLASLVEREVKTDKDRKIVAGIFRQRLLDDHPLQSCATLAYVLGEDKLKFSLKDIEVDSVYNTYKYPGLPPGPIANPGLEAIRATLHPQTTDYYFFLSDPKTGEIIYARTNEEHIINKAKYGL